MTKKNLKINLKKLNNGIPVLYELIPHIRSVSFKVLINVGSRHESDNERGMAHFIEHMMFKGTSIRSAFHIANSIERHGGHFNAYTSKEETVYLAKVIDEQLNSTIDIFYDMLSASKLDADDIEQEKGVVIEEINGTLDAPDDIIWDIFNEKLLNPDDAGKPTLGTKASVRSFTAEGLKAFWKKHYNAENIAIVAVGNIDEDIFIEKLNNSFGTIEKKSLTKSHLTETNNKFIESYQRDIEQIHILIGKKVCEYANPDRLKLVILNNILGGGMSSRLFQQIREKHGYAYQVFSAMDFMSDHGVAYNYIASDKKNYQASIDLSLEEIDKIKQGLVLEHELDDAKTQLKGALLLSLENNSQRADKILRHYIRFAELIDIDSLVNQINTITLNDIKEVAEKYFEIETFSIAKIGALK